MNSRETLKINSKGHLTIGGADTMDIVKDFGTPLYLIDEKYFRSVAKAYRGAILSNYGKGNVAYASKAFSAVAIYRIAAEEGLSADVVSGGEIFTALKAGFDPSKLYFHGNNKLPSELEFAISSGVGKICIDNISELPLIDALSAKYGRVQKVLVRINPGVEAHTHDYIKTAKVDSKFAFVINTGDADYVIAERMGKRDKELGLGTPELTIEPGRSLIGEAGITLYSVGTIKEIKGIRKYVAIDGGMTDNIRPALYGAKYEVMCANRANELHEDVVTIAGKCCESGDIIAKDVKLPQVVTGDIIAVFSTGAYCYSMASHYNRNILPPVVTVYEGKADYIIKPENYEDITRNDVVPERLKG